MLGFGWKDLASEFHSVCDVLRGFRGRAGGNVKQGCPFGALGSMDLGVRGALSPV